MVARMSAAICGEGDISDLRSVLADETFDLVLSSLVLHYQADLSAVFGECARLLRSSGTLVFSTHHPVDDEVSILDPGYLNAELIEEELGVVGNEDVLLPKTAARFDRAACGCRICH
jgi:SAM-dependent methyltransferase